MTPEEVFSVYGVDVTKLSTEYSTYRVATDQDLWLCAVDSPRKNTDPTGVIDVRVGDLIIESPDDFRSNVYIYKIPSRHVNLTGPDFFYYIYYPSVKTGSLKESILYYLDSWVRDNKRGTLTIRFSNAIDLYEVDIICMGDGNIAAAIKKNQEASVETSLDTVFSKFGSLFLVQRSDRNSSSSPSYLVFVGDLPK